MSCMESIRKKVEAEEHLKWRKLNTIDFFLLEIEREKK